jgi:hypothetical protein
MRYRRGIDESKLNLTRSRIACERQKFSLAERTRKEREEHVEILSQEREVEQQKKRMKCETVREGEKVVHLTMSQIKQSKKVQAD